MQRLIETPKNDLEKLEKYLAARYSSSQMPAINELEKLSIKNAIQNIQYPYSIKDIQVYINEETANLLSSSSHPVLKEWGEKCKQVYIDLSLNKFIEPTSGLVVAKRGGISFTNYGMSLSFAGNGVWSVSISRWVASPGSQCMQGSSSFSTYLDGMLYTNGFLSMTSSAINPPNLSTSPLKLLSPLHIAVLLDDVQLMKYLISKDFRVDDDLNDWHLTPIEFAVMFDRSNAMECLLQNNAIKNIDKALKLAVEKGSFSLLEKLTEYATLTQEAIDAAMNRDKNFYYYLEGKRKNDVLEKLKTQNPLVVLQSFLNQTVMPLPLPSIIDLICDYPEVITMPLSGDTDNNPILHWAITSKDIKKVETLLVAIFQSGFMTGKSVFDAEKKNGKGKTILDLALELGNDEITAAVLLYANPKLSDEQKLKLVKFDIYGIGQKREGISQKITQAHGYAISIHENVSRGLAMGMIELKEENNYLLECLKRQQLQIEEQNEQLYMLKQVTMQMYQYLSLDNRVQNNHPPFVLQQPLLSQEEIILDGNANVQEVVEPIPIPEVNNHNGFFGRASR